MIDILGKLDGLNQLDQLYNLNYGLDLMVGSEGVLKIFSQTMRVLINQCTIEMSPLYEGIRILLNI